MILRRLKNFIFVNKHFVNKLLFKVFKKNPVILYKWTQKGSVSYLLLLVVFHINTSFFAEIKIKTKNSKLSEF